ncbi:MAG: peptidase M75 [Bacteroidales bacterium]|nr:peptidase M75 [Bacteroidales bacterium]
MKHSFSKTIAVALASATLVFASCGKDDDTAATTNAGNAVSVADAQAAAIAAQFVDHTVAPTYMALAAKAEQLASELAALKANPDQNGFNQACSTFLAAREQWEKSEAFLFGAAGDFGVDPHIDSWPLDETAFANLMASPNMLASLNADDGDVVAGEQLGQALLGFHGIEYILFAGGQPKNVSDITADQWIYVVAVAGDLRNRCYQLEVGWLGDDAPAAHIAKLDDIELQYTVASSAVSYGENMKNAGNAGSTYRTKLAAVMAIVQGSIDIADEVGTSKINAAYSGDDVTYIESPYSYMSYADFINNIKSIENVYYGGVEGQRDNSKSLHSLLGSANAALDAKVEAAISNAIAKIEAAKAVGPFALNYTNAANGVAVEACAALSDALSEINEALRTL